MISLGFPWALLALPLPLLIWWLVPPHKEQVPALRFPFFRRIVAAAGTDAASGAVVMRRSVLQMVSAVLVWSLLVVAMARPERVGAPIEQTRAARDVVLAIDISGSMDAHDFNAPDGTVEQRLQGVRQVVDGFISGRDGDRMALIVFGSKAYVQSPLTEDLQTIRDLLSQTEVGMAGPHTALGDSIGLAIRTFEASDIKQRLLILLSDGTDTVSRMSPVNAAEIARDRGIEIYTIGIGNPKATGEEKVDLKALQDIAQRTGGQYFYAEDSDGLHKVYERIDELAPRETEALSYRPRQALAWLPMLLAALIGIGSTGYLAMRRTKSGARA
ncbi:VWA domain-containing protein [Paracoccus aestuariivivens]|uniref:VWA domain-containing protein n=1 Tax=Paracoccus aestuariivivens TaxID=1820333 RepID=A0A6L6JAS6_9RHOB|nr:VWA domain-containing protein [Paracoccus aestuariivivens]MTH77061.1 VWA domain-containing protein [Paracoccus aestuariivivens]